MAIAVPEKVLDKLIQMIPMTRMGKPEGKKILKEVFVLNVFHLLETLYSDIYLYFRSS